MKYLYVFLCFALLPFQSVIFAADNEIYLDQSGTTLNLDIEQLGISNIIGGLNSAATLLVVVIRSLSRLILLIHTELTALIKT